MKKIKLLSLLAVLFASFFVFIQGTYAAEITDSKYENGRIYLSGTGDTPQVQLVLFDLDNSPLYMTTVATENGQFSVTLPEIADLKDGNYTVKVADYDGKNISSKKIAVSTKKEVISAAKTGDENMISLLCVFLTIASGAILIFLSIRKNVKKV